MLIGIECLPFQHEDGDDFPGHRRRDLGIAHVGFGGVHLRRGLLHLRGKRSEVGDCHIGTGLGDVAVAGRDELSRKECVVAGLLQLGEYELRPLYGALRGHVLERRVGPCERVVR